MVLLNPERMALLLYTVNCFDVIFMELAIPPLHINEPVDVEVESTVERENKVSKEPVIPPYMLLILAIPPLQINEPVDVDVDSTLERDNKVSKLPVIPPYMLLTLAIPPLTMNAPVEVDVESVVLVIKFMALGIVEGFWLYTRVDIIN